MEAIILVGGLGTRLGDLTKNTPKPMLPIRGIPFLKRLLQFLKAKGFKRVILAVGYKKEVVERYFSVTDDSLPDIIYSVESSPLGTGGAIAQALKYTDTNHVYVLNGDSFLDVNFEKVNRQHKNKNSDITIASYFIDPADRYGVMQVNSEDKIISFTEKGEIHRGLINGGVYLLNTQILINTFRCLDKGCFSFEDMILANDNLGLRKYHVQQSGYFLDIGIPTDYERAQSELFL